MKKNKKNSRSKKKNLQIYIYHTHVYTTYPRTCSKVNNFPCDSATCGRIQGPFNEAEDKIEPLLPRENPPPEIPDVDVFGADVLFCFVKKEERKLLDPVVFFATINVDRCGDRCERMEEI